MFLSSAAVIDNDEKDASDQELVSSRGSVGSGSVGSERRTEKAIFRGSEKHVISHEGLGNQIDERRESPEKHVAVGGKAGGKVVNKNAPQNEEKSKSHGIEHQAKTEESKNKSGGSGASNVNNNDDSDYFVIGSGSNSKNSNQPHDSTTVSNITTAAPVTKTNQTNVATTSTRASSWPYEGSDSNKVVFRRSG